MRGEKTETCLRGAWPWLGAVAVLALSAAPAAAETEPKDKAAGPAPTLVWEYRLERAASTDDSPITERDIVVGPMQNDGVTVAFLVRAAGATTPPSYVLAAVKLSPDGKLVWDKTYPDLPAGGVHAFTALGGDRMALFVTAAAPVASAGGVHAGRIVVIAPDGALERNVAIDRPRGSAKEDFESNFFNMRVARGRGGFVVFGEYGPGPAFWYLSAFDGAGRRLWERGLPWASSDMLTRVDDAHVSADGTVTALVVRGPLGEKNPPRALLQTFAPGGKTVASREFGRGQLSCWAFAAPATLVASFDQEIVWFDLHGRRQRAIPAPVRACPLAFAADGTLAAGGSFTVGPARERILTFELPGGSKVVATSPALDGGLLAILSGGYDDKTAPIALRRYAAP